MTMMDRKLELELKKDPRGRALMKIQELTTEGTDGFAATDMSYVPVYEGYTAYDAGEGYSRVYLILTKGGRVLIYSVEIPDRIYPGTSIEEVKLSKFGCVLMEMDSPEDLEIILSDSDDRNLARIPKTTPRLDETGKEFITSNALWLSNPTLN